MSNEYNFDAVGSDRVQTIIRLTMRKIHQAMDEDEAECRQKFNMSPGASKDELTQLYNGFDDSGRRNCPYKRANKVAKSLAPIMLWGPPGVGKSQIVIGVTKEEKVGIVDVRLAQKDPTDMRGIPVPDDDPKSPFYKAVKWFLSSEWPREWSSRGIIFFDELTAADKTIQVSAYEMILDRKLGDVGEGKTGYEVPPGWLIVAAGNQRQDRAVSQPMSSALANRFLHLVVKASAKDWLNWARRSNVHPSVINYIESDNALVGVSADAKLHNMDPKFFDLEKGWPSPRSWERVSNILHAYDRMRDASSKSVVNVDAKDVRRNKVKNKIFSRFNVSSLTDMVNGLVGPGTEFMSFWEKQENNSKIFEAFVNLDNVGEYLTLNLANKAKDPYATESVTIDPRVKSLSLEAVLNWYNDPNIDSSTKLVKYKAYFAKTVQIWTETTTGLGDDDNMNEMINRAVAMSYFLPAYFTNLTKAEFNFIPNNPQSYQEFLAKKEKILVNIYKIINSVPLTTRGGVIRRLGLTMGTLSKNATPEVRKVILPLVDIQDQNVSIPYLEEKMKFDQRIEHTLFPKDPNGPKDYKATTDLQLDTAKATKGLLAPTPSTTSSIPKAGASKKKVKED